MFDQSQQIDIESSVGLMPIVPVEIGQCGLARDEVRMVDRNQMQNVVGQVEEMDRMMPCPDAERRSRGGSGGMQRSTIDADHQRCWTCPLEFPPAREHRGIQILGTLISANRH